MPAQSDADRSMIARLRNFALEPLRQEFVEQGAFLLLENFLAPEATAQLIAAVADVTASVNRNYLPGHKQGGSVSRHTIDRMAPFIADLYRSPALIEWLGQLAGEPMQVSPVQDPHAYALYFYSRPGDHIGWHYDTSYYAGRRYTLLIGVVDESTCQLEYELHTREPGAAVKAGDEDDIGMGFGRTPDRPVKFVVAQACHVQPFPRLNNPFRPQPEIQRG